jgi:uncharacterized protein YjbI with pentapeptide repeats
MTKSPTPAMSELQPVPRAEKAAPRFGRFFRFRLRTLLLLTLLLSVALAAFTWRLNRARHQADLVRRLTAGGAWVQYDYDFVIGKDGRRETLVSSYVSPLRRFFGNDFLHTARRLQTPLELPERFDRFDRALFHEALSSGPPWWALDICSQTIHTDDLDRISRQSQLENLNFDRVVFGQKNLEPLAELKQLKGLGFRLTDLSDCDLSPISHQSELRSLAFTQCKTTNAQLHQIKNLTKLNRLQIEEVVIGDADRSWLREFPNLEGLWLLNSDFCDSDFAYLYAMDKLNNLRINVSNVYGRDIDNDRLPGSLTFLDLSDSPLESGAFIGHLPNLQICVLNNTRLTADALAEIEWPAKLEILLLLGHAVDSRVLDNLRRLPALQTLHLSKGLVETTDLTFFEAQTPQCKVVLSP